MKKKKLELELAATQKQLGVIPGIGAGVGMEVPANQLSNHVYQPSISVVSAPTPPVRLEKIVSGDFSVFFFLLFCLVFVSKKIIENWTIYTFFLRFLHRLCTYLI